jgi:hypothetical protein
MVGTKPVGESESSDNRSFTSDLIVTLSIFILKCKRKCFLFTACRRSSKMLKEVKINYLSINITTFAT